MIVINNKEITSYGKSMYGGWYANYYENKIHKARIYYNADYNVYFNIKHGRIYLADCIRA